MRHYFPVLIACMILFTAVTSWGYQYHDQMTPATRDEVTNHIIPATLGKFFVRKGALTIPVFPKGFPQWTDKRSVVISILGRPLEETNLYGMLVDVYDTPNGRIGVGYIDKQMALICFNYREAKMYYYSNRVGWEKLIPPSRSNFASPVDRDSYDIYRISFYNGRRTRKYPVYCWEDLSNSTSLPRKIRIIGLEEAFEQSKILEDPYDK